MLRKDTRLGFSFRSGGLLAARASVDLAKFYGA
ncbi:hypothetical protein N185_22975 [Sinorhizobium sp. GW3]|nr:hypothetical protein N185_22975 [Sinorhizobium sp. GW3]